MATHTQQKLYSCSFCPKEFFSNSNMYKHLRNLHNAQWEAQKNKKFFSQ